MLIVAQCSADRRQDEVELQWRALREAFPTSFPFIEVYWDKRGNHTFEAMAAAVAAFAGVPAPAALPHKNRHTPRAGGGGGVVAGAGGRATHATAGEVEALRAAYLAAMPAGVAAALRASTHRPWSAALSRCSFYVASGGPS